MAVKEKRKLDFTINFAISGVAAAPIERVKLLLQSQGEMLK